MNNLRDVLNREFPNALQLVPTEAELDVMKFGQGANVITDTCNAARKLRRILVETIKDCYEFDCMHHLRNVWFGNMEKRLTTKLNLILRSSLDEIDPTLRVSASISAMIRAIDKEFSLSANYPKGHGQLFLEWMREKHPGALLLHVERSSGSRQDLCTEGSMAIFMNYPYYIEFLDQSLRKRKKSEKASILQQNLFVALTSSEMIALVRLLSIFHVSVCMPIRWLAGKTQDLKEYEWGPMSMGRVLDTLEASMIYLSKHPDKILDEKYMMNIFKEYIDELPPFKEYWEQTFNKKQTTLIARKSGAKVVHFARLKRELFSPVRSTIKKTKARVTELAETAVDAILTELHDENKATNKYLSVSGSEYSWKHCSEERKLALLGTAATNDQAESTLGGCTSQIQRFGRIALSSAAAISDMCRNGFLHRPTGAKGDNKPRGIFHEFDDALRHAIVKVAMRDAPATRERNNKDIELQAEARRIKEELEKGKNMEKATEEYVEAVYLISMYYSDACLKDDPRNVKKLLKKLKTKKAKYDALKSNILIRVKGFNWEWCAHPWSKNGHVYSVHELAKHVEWIIREEKKRKLKIPKKPTPNVPKRKNTGVLGTPVDEVAELEKQYMEDEGDFEKRASKIQLKREVSGESSIYSRMQPFDRPDIETLLNRRIDYLFTFDKGTKDEQLCWCQGEVIEVGMNAKKPNLVNVYWDPVPNSDKYSDHTTEPVELLPTLWNKNKDKSWRLDIDVTLMAESDDDSAVNDEEISDSDESGNQSKDENDSEGSEYTDEE